MKLIVGLGNPGREYARTRHNVGYMVVEALAERWSLGGWKSKFDGLIVEGNWRSQRVALLQPTTFMNLSGQSVVAAARFHKCQPADLLIVGDDLDLLPGKLRVREQGSSGGQRGLEDVITRLGTNALPRLRIGIGRPARGQVVDYILSPFDRADEEWLPGAIDRACAAAECWLMDGTTKAMNEFNRDPKEDGGSETND